MDNSKAGASGPRQWPDFYAVLGAAPTADVIALHCHHTAGGQFLDVGIVPG